MCIKYELASYFVIILLVINLNGVLLVNKPSGFTSHDVVNKLRKTLGTKKIGHTGTLDPQATGVLMVLIGTSTKILPFIKNSSKEYVAKLKFGFSSNTYDIWGDLTENPKPLPSITEVEKSLGGFVGEQKQIPPMVSAIKVKGKKLYEYERAGKTIEVEPREICIKELELLSYDDDLEFRCLCSSGTYIRSLCVDIAESLGQSGVMSSLVRTRIDSYSLDDCYTLDQIEKNEYKLLSNYDVLSEYRYEIMDNIEDILHGKQIRLDCKDDIVMIVNEQIVVAAYEHVGNGIYKSKRGLW